MREPARLQVLAAVKPRPGGLLVSTRVGEPTQSGAAGTWPGLSAHTLRTTLCNTFPTTQKIQVRWQMSSSLQSLLPVAGPQGHLSTWLLFVGLTSTINGLTNLFKGAASHKVYSSQQGRLQATPLSSRVFGIWNLTSSVVRLMAAYRVDQRTAYELAMATFAIALVHFSSEAFVHRTMDLRQPGSIFPFFFAAGSLLWMASQYGYYVA
ncbi:unnamed protein product [Parajaminaea phylloscopi]